MTAQNAPCPFFSNCGGCSYLNLSDEQYQKIKIIQLEKDLAEIFKNNIDTVLGLDNQALANKINLEFFSVGAKSRRKIMLQVGEKNQLGFFAKASKDLVEIDICFVAQDEISAIILPLKNFLKTFENNCISQIAITAFDSGIDVVFVAKRELNFSQTQKIATFAKAFKINASCRLKNQLTPILMQHQNQISYANFHINLTSDIFIQATKKGLQKITQIIAEFIKNKFEKKILVADIYTGFGAYSFGVVELVKEIDAFEGSEEMTKLITKNALKNGFNSRIKSHHRDLIVFPVSERELLKYDLAIINPPRNGAGPQIFKIADSALKNLIYVSCNPKTFARDAKILLAKGFKITQLVAIDQFYSSPHLEVVAVLERNL